MISNQHQKANTNQYPFIIFCYKSTLKNQAFLKSLLPIMNIPLNPQITLNNNSLNLHFTEANSQIKHNFISLTYDSSFFEKNLQYLSSYTKGKPNLFCALINSNFNKYEPFIDAIASIQEKNRLCFITTSPVFLKRKTMHKGNKFIYIPFDNPQALLSNLLHIDIEAPPSEGFLNKKRKLRIDKSSKRLEGNALTIKSRTDNSDDSDSSNDDIDEPITARNILILLTEKVFQFIQKNETNINEVTNYILKLVLRKSRTIKHKNIERRVYDIINVMKACGVLSKKKKSITTFFNNESNNDASNEAIAIEKSTEQGNPDDEHVDLMGIRQEIEEKKCELIKKCRELLFYKSILSKNKANENGKGKDRASDKLFFPFYLFKCNSDMSIKQNDINSKVVVLSKEKIELLNPIDVIEVFTLNNFNISNMKDLVSQSLYQYLDENNLMSSTCSSIKEDEILSHARNERKHSLSDEQKSFELIHLETDPLNDLFEINKPNDYGNINSMMLIKHEDIAEDEDKDNPFYYCFHHL